MSKNVLFKVLLAAAAVCVSVLWLLSLMMKETFGFFNLNWAIAIFSGICGIAYILKGIIEKKSGVLKKVNIFFGAGLLIICLISISGAIMLPKNYILPIIAIILTAALLIGIFAVGGKSWNQGDNQNVGYKNYYQRKAEEEKKNRKEDKDEE